MNDRGFVLEERAEAAVPSSSNSREVIGGKWKAVILWELHAQARRFGELKRLLPGISEKMLIQQLREMEADGLVDRVVFHQVPPRVEYSATKLGASLNLAMGPLADWGDRYLKHMANRKGSDGATTRTSSRPSRQ